MTEREIFEFIKQYIKRDSFAVLIMMFALTVCAYTLLTVDSYQDKINDVWMQQWEESGCFVTPFKPNVSFKWTANYDMEGSP